MAAADDARLGQLWLQIHRERAPAFELAVLAATAESVARATPGLRGFGASESEDEGGYANLVFAAQSPREAWPALRDALFSAPGLSWLADASVCLGCQAGDWDEGELLHHFDPARLQAAKAGGDDGLDADGPDDLGDDPDAGPSGR